MSVSRLLFALVVTASALAQPVPLMLWSRTYGGTSTQCGFAMCETPDGGYILAGVTYRDGCDAYVVKTDSLGDTIWTRTYGGREGDWCNDIQVVPQGGYVSVGLTGSYGDQDGDVYLVRIDDVGDTMWTRTYGETDYDEGYAVRPTRDGGYVVAGYSISSGSRPEYYVVRTDSAGNPLWTRTYERGWSIAHAAQQLSDGGFLVAGLTATPEAACALRTDSLGDTLWTRVYGAEGCEGAFYAMCVAPDGGFVFAGLCGSGSPRVYVVRTDSNGDTIWTRQYPPLGSPSWLRTTWAEDVDACPAGGYILGGTIEIDSGWVFSRVYALRIAENGDTLWSYSYAEHGIQDEGYAIASTADGGYAIAGTARVGGYTYDMYLIKTGPDALPVWERTLPVPADVTLEVYPNPFNATAVLRFTLPRAGNARLLVYDLLGRKVLVENLGPLQAGEHRHTLNASDLPSGIYFARLEALGLERVQKMVVLR